MLWRPGDHDRWMVELVMKEQALLWSLTVAFDEGGLPVFVTICDRSLKVLGGELLGSNHTSTSGCAVLGGN